MTIGTKQSDSYSRHRNNQTSVVQWFLIISKARNPRKPEMKLARIIRNELVGVI